MLGAPSSPLQVPESLAKHLPRANEDMHFFEMKNINKFLFYFFVAKDTTGKAHNIFTRED